MRFLFFMLCFCFLSNSGVGAVNENQLRDFLVKYQARDTDEITWDRLSYAVEKGYLEVASFFIRRGDQIRSYTSRIPVDYTKVHQPEYLRDRRDLYFKHPLITAIRKGYNELAIEMLQMGADVYAEELKEVLRKSGYNNVTRKIEIKSAFYVYLTEGKTDNSLMTAFLSHDLANKEIKISGSDEQEHIQYSSTPLIIAICENRLDEARMLLEQGSSVYDYGVAYQKDVDPPGIVRYKLYGSSPLGLSVLSNNKAAVFLLLEYGADPLMRVGNDSPVDLALRCGYDELVDLLLSAACK